MPLVNRARNVVPARAPASKPTTTRPRPSMSLSSPIAHRHVVASMSSRERLSESLQRWPVASSSAKASPGAKRTPVQGSLRSIDSTRRPATPGCAASREPDHLPRRKCDSSRRGHVRLTSFSSLSACCKRCNSLPQCRSRVARDSASTRLCSAAAPCASREGPRTEPTPDRVLARRVWPDPSDAHCLRLASKPASSPCETGTVAMSGSNVKVRWTCRISLRT